jgi:nitrate reductase NapE component
MDEFRNRQNITTSESSGNAPEEEPAYPPSIEKMSEKWRSIQQQIPDQQKRGFFERNYLVLGIGIGLLIIAFLIVIGGFAFLVWNAR